MANEGKNVLAQGRIVWVVGGRSENLFKGSIQTEFGTNTPKFNKKTGEQIIQYGFGLAIPIAELSDPVRGAIWAAAHEEAWTMYPSRQIPPAFAMKFKDGVNGIDENGRPYSLREGWNGCYVFALTTNLPIRFFKWENGGNLQIADGIKCGDYVEVQVSVKAHAAEGQGKPGLYMNPMMVRLIASGKEIVNAPSGDMVFGANAPGAPTNYVPPEMGAMPQPGPAVLQGPPQPMMPAPTAAAPQPHYGVLPPVHQPPPGGVPLTPMPQPGFAPSVAAPYPTAPQGFAAPVAAAPYPTMPAPTGYPQAPAQMGAYPTNAGGFPVPGGQR